MFYIYHIKGVKIGATEDLFDRMRHYGRPDYEILETHTCEFKVSDREIELQKEYGYKVDTIPFWKSYRLGKNGNRGKSYLQSLSSKERKEFAAKGGRISGKHPNYTMRKLDYQIAEYIRAQYKRGKDVFGNRITQQRFADIFSVDQAVISKILRNINYTTP